MAMFSWPRPRGITRATSLFHFALNRLTARSPGCRCQAVREFEPPLPFPMQVARLTGFAPLTDDAHRSDDNGPLAGRMKPARPKKRQCRSRMIRFDNIIAQLDASSHGAGPVGFSMVLPANVSLFLASAISFSSFEPMASQYIVAWPAAGEQSVNTKYRVS